MLFDDDEFEAAALNACHDHFLKHWLVQATNMMLPQEAATLFVRLSLGDKEAFKDKAYKKVVVAMVKNGTFEEALKAGLQAAMREKFPDEEPNTEDIAASAVEQFTQIKKELGIE
jgi:hypothetical protein